MKIFVQIASYRDPQLIHTLRSLLDNATNPSNLKICIAHQYSDLDDFCNDINVYRNDDRFIIMDIPYENSLGCCWARNLIQQKYTDEKYTLQLDSHHRFVKGWDDLLISMLTSLQDDGFEKPLITTYLPSYNPSDESKVNETWWMQFDRFIPEGPVFFSPASFISDKPISSRFYSGHFAFTLGEFCNEVQHDPELYFHGEEITIAVRAYTHGYDLFHPHKIVAWHEYTRNGRVKHWDDDDMWWTKNTKSHYRTKAILGIDGICSCTVDVKKYGLGSKRSLESYEAYAGIRFKDRKVQKYTLDNKFAPNPKIDDFEDYNNSFLNKFKHCIDLNRNELKDNYTFIAFIFEDVESKSLYRKDIPLEELKKQKGEFLNIWCEFFYDTKPYKYIIYPYSNEGWVNKQEIIL